MNAETIKLDSMHTCFFCFKNLYYFIGKSSLHELAFANIQASSASYNLLSHVLVCDVPQGGINPS